MTNVPINVQEANPDASGVGEPSERLPWLAPAETTAQPASGPTPSQYPPVRILQPEDAESICTLTTGTGVFTPVEITVVQELLADALDKGAASEYHFLVYGPTGQVLGFVCYGPTPLTDGAFDLYWIATAITAQGQGVGSTLVRATEAAVRAAGGRLLLIETSSTAAYTAARRLYERHGYTLLARVPDFYRDGDDRLIYGKRFKESSIP